MNKYLINFCLNNFVFETCPFISQYLNIFWRPTDNYEVQLKTKTTNKVMT